MANGYKVLYRKYRPDCFENVVGQNNVIKLLKDSIINNKISHAYIFSGPRGTGKTSTAKIFAKAINCLDPIDGSPCGKCENCINFSTSNDIYEIDAASNNGVDQIREIIDNIKLSPISFRYKVYIIDEVHMLSISAFNALLLTLEEPPSHVVFILATTNIEDVPITILSRCQRMDFKKISDNIIFDRLNDICKLENISIEDEALIEISSFADGGLRDALSILDSLSKLDKKVTVDDVLDSVGLVSNKVVDDLINNIENSNVDEIINFVKKVRELSCDYQILVKKIINSLILRAIKVQKLEYSSPLDYSDYKNLCFELTDTMYKANVHVDSFSLLELILISFCNTGFDDDKVKISSVDKKSVYTSLSKSDNVQNSTKSVIETNVTIDFGNSNEQFLSSLVDVRINNCFVDANKIYLNNSKDLYNNFLNSLNNKKLKGILADSEIVLASSNIMVIKTNFDDSSLLINENLDLISSEFKKVSSESYSFVAVSLERWQKEMDTFMKNKKNGVIYSFKDEPIFNENNKLVEDVFQKDIVEVK